MLRSSISENAEMYGTTIQFFPTKLTLAQFEAALNKRPFGLYRQNSLIVARLTTFLTVVLSSLAALARSSSSTWCRSGCSLSRCSSA